MLSGTLPCDAASHPTRWQFSGPANWVSSTAGSLPSASATEALATTDNGTTWLLGTVNGGVWRSSDLSTGPHWTNVLDGQPVACSSISALAAHGPLVVAGCGPSTSSENGDDWNVANTGAWAGVMLSADGGGTWRMTKFPPNYHVSSVLNGPGGITVAARSHYFDKNEGGVWHSSDLGETWRRTLSSPVYTLAREPASGVALAGVPWTTDGGSVMLSRSAGRLADWTPWASGLDWGGRAVFYPTFAFGKSVAFVGALTVNRTFTPDTNSAIFHRPLSDLSATPGSGAWARVAGGPNLEQDAMPKDKMALLAHPEDESILFVAGNAGSATYRVDWARGSWASMMADDTSDGYEPHVDCRNYYFSRGELLLVSDGGTFARERPEAKGGRWRSLNGDLGAMEFVHVSWDAHAGRWVGGAQDNCAQVAPPGASPTAASTCVVNGDGTVTAADNSVEPARLYSTVQFLGVGGPMEDEAERERGGRERVGRERVGREHDEGAAKGGAQRFVTASEVDEDCSFCFVQGARKVGIPLARWFSRERGFPDQPFPFFIHPYKLHANTPSTLVLWAAAGGGEPAGWWSLEVPPNTTSGEQLSPPAFVCDSAGGEIYDFVAGGVTSGAPDPSVLIGLNGSALFVRSRATAGKLLVRPLPSTFARPITFPIKDGRSILGPVS